jgi:hypothetical protein
MLEPYAKFSQFRALTVVDLPTDRRPGKKKLKKRLSNHRGGTFGETAQLLGEVGPCALHLQGGQLRPWLVPLSPVAMASTASRSEVPSFDLFPSLAERPQRRTSPTAM